MLRQPPLLPQSILPQLSLQVVTLYYQYYSHALLLYYLHTVGSSVTPTIKSTTDDSGSSTDVIPIVVGVSVTVVIINIIGKLIIITCTLYGSKFTAK